MSAYRPLRRAWLSISNGFTWDKAVISGRLLEVGFRPIADAEKSAGRSQLQTLGKRGIVSQ